ncbi:MAG: cysteine desulfurase, partial [Gemmatimonadota bacterium]|nr:cysteine desulfurase [Gemmatimonadota bacterium]
YLNDAHGNPSSIHGIGRHASEAVRKSRTQVANLLHTKARRIVFTGGGSEADNLAVKGIAFARAEQGKHLITTTVEHPAILSTCRFLEKMGYEVTYLPVDGTGLVDPKNLAAAIRPDTILVSIMMANNEVGTIQPIVELCSIAHERGVVFHTDAVQAVGKIDVDVEALDIDLLSLSAHKLHGPKGVGALYVRPGIELESLVHGGTQENGLRAGTENVPSIVGFGRAAELAQNTVKGRNEMAKLRDRLEAGLRNFVPNLNLNGHPTLRLPNTLNVTFPGLRGESLVVAMDQHGISLSSGSACKSGSPEPTHVLIAMGASEEEAHCAVRFSLSNETTSSDIDATIDTVGRVLEKMATTVRFLPCK